MSTLDDIRISNSESSTSSTPKSQNQNLSSHRGYDELLAECRLNRAPQSPLEREYLLDETRQVAQRYLADIGTVESREQLLKILHSQHSLLSPIRKLPPEIVTEIFCFIVAENPLEFGTTPHYQLKPRVRDADVLTLTWVCFWWRSLALSRPSLWSLIDVRIQDHYWAPSERMQFLEECLQRSIPPSGLLTPLNLAVYLHSNSDAVSSHVSNILHVLLDHSGRWKHLTLWNWGRTALNKLNAMLVTKQALPGLDSNLSAATSRLPVLEKLELRMLNSRALKAQLFNRCPHLEELRINHLRTSYLRLIDIQKLVVLEVTEVYDGPPFATLLQKFPLLQRLTVNSYNVTVSPHLDFVHTHLTSLTLANVQENEINSGAWERLHLPNLTHLGIAVYPVTVADSTEYDDEEVEEDESKWINGDGDLVSWDGIEEPLNELLDMVIRSKCTLEKVFVQDVSERILPKKLAGRDDPGVVGKLPPVVQRFLTDLPGKPTVEDVFFD